MLDVYANQERTQVSDNQKEQQETTEKRKKREQKWATVYLNANETLLFSESKKFREKNCMQHTEIVIEVNRNFVKCIE